MIIVRQSTSRTVIVGPVLDADGVAVTDGVVGDFKISKNGGAPAALNGSATLTHRHTGFYSLALTASDLDTVGQAEVSIDDTVNACPLKPLTVIEEAVYDAFFAASALGYVANAPVNVAQFGGSAGTFSGGRPEIIIQDDGITAAKIAANAIGASEIADGAIDAGAIAADAITSAKIADGAITAAKIADGAIDAATFAAGAINAAAIASDAITDAKVASDVTIASVTGAVGSVTGNVGGNVTGTIGGLTTAAKAEVQQEAEDALAAVGVTTTVTGRIDAAVSTRASQTSVDTVDDFLDTEVAAIKAKTDQLTFTTANQVDARTRTLDTDVITAAAVAASAVTELQSGLSTLDAAGVRTAVGLGSANLDTQLAKLDTIDDFLDTEVAAIKAKTDNLPSDPADASDISAAFSTVNTTLATIAAFIDTEVAAIKTVTDQLAAAQAEPSGVPAANASPLAKIAWLAALARNKVTQTATTQALRNDADSGNIATAAVSDDGSTFTRAEWQ